MDIGSDCSGGCLLCTAAGGCLAGHGDDDFEAISAEEAKRRFDSGKYPGRDGRDFTAEELELLRKHFDGRG